MAEITAATVKALRDRTGLPMMDCKKALDECGGDSDVAVQWLRERGPRCSANVLTGPRISGVSAWSPDTIRPLLPWWN